tara:strand:- start:31 stop:471 length:441 start_codon:yes stop_codon:yes gene_type:complete
MNWKDPETWEEAAKAVAQLIAENEFLEKRKDFYKGLVTERSAELVRAIRMLQDEGINFEMEEARAKAHASGDLAELLNEEPTRYLVEFIDHDGIQKTIYLYGQSVEQIKVIIDEYEIVVIDNTELPEQAYWGRERMQTGRKENDSE